jgi:hypothetical protein
VPCFAKRFRLSAPLRTDGHVAWENVPCVWPLQVPQTDANDALRIHILSQKKCVHKQRGSDQRGLIVCAFVVVVGKAVVTRSLTS